MSRLNRFEWMKAVLKSALPCRAKTLASALAVEFANEETGQLNPSIDTLAAYLAASKDTIKRAVADLIKGGWLSRTEGRGRGNRTSYTLLSPGKLLAFAPQKKGAALHLQPAQKGATLRGKGRRTAPSYNKDKQSFEQRAQAAPDRPAQHCQFEVRRGSDGEAAWNAWLDRAGYPRLTVLDQRLNAGWNLPGRQPPTDPEGIDWRIAEKWASWASCRCEERAIA